MVELGNRIRDLRKQKHLTQQQLAERLGVSKAMVSAYETGIRCPSYEVLIKLARTFGVSADYLLGINSRRFIDTDGLTESQTEAVANIAAEFRKSNKK